MKHQNDAQKGLFFAVLGSGSSGNCAVVRSEHTCLLLDAGLSVRQTSHGLESLGLTLEDIDGVLITHEHSDHAQGLQSLCHEREVPVFCTSLTQESLALGFQNAKPQWHLLEAGSALEFQDLRIESFSVPHDALDPVGFIISDADSRLGVLCDAGCITPLIWDRLQGLHTLFVEANYEVPLLDADTKRPPATKQRIAGSHGHLSNDQVAELVRDIAHEGLHRVVLGHLSQDCNDPEVARDRVVSALHQTNAPEAVVVCAPRREPTPWFRVARP